MALKDRIELIKGLVVLRGMSNSLLMPKGSEDNSSLIMKSFNSHKLRTKS